MPLPPKKREVKLDYREVWLKTCVPLVQEHHYSRRMPSVVKLAYGVVDYGPPKVLLACCLFSLATGRWETDNLWELTRLVRLPTFTEPLTRLIGTAVGHIRKHKLTDLVVSFADAEEDHHGGIYQAASWIYDGMRGERLDGINVDGRFIPARTCNATYGTSSPELLQQRLTGHIVEPHYDIGKHCYWRALTKDGMQRALRLGLCSRGYPKPMLGNGEDANGDANYRIDGHRRKGVVDLPGYIRDDGQSADPIDAGIELL